MNFLNKLRLGTRLGLGFAVVLALLLVAVGTAVLSLNQADAAARRTVEVDMVTADATATLNTYTRANARRTMELFFARDEAHADKIRQMIAFNKKKVTESLETLERLAYLPEGKALVGKVKEARVAYVGSFGKVSELLAAGRRDEANRLLMDETLPAIDVLQEHVEALHVRQQALVKDSANGLSDSIAASRMLMLAVGAVALLVGMGLAWGLTRSITAPLHQAVQVARTVAAGDLTARIDVQRGDETGELLGALRDMNESLTRIVTQVRHGSESIATGSAQISSGNADLSQRTEQQASNLQETAAAMEQLTSTVKQNADTANMATQLAGSASQAAEQGGEVMGRVVATMEEISTGSRRIADIIGTIDGIAFQTNILALNAAVEAARAGEQGRGFAVVAGEVRSLAQRSAEAAKEIKTLIGQSVEKVEAGSRLVGDAGRSMSDLVTQVKRVSDLINEISSASNEQGQGISQVSEAIAQLDHVTQQNAALVEESAASADSLNQQAAQLLGVVGSFRLNAGAA
ncbi:methyl-accepting chemotaxis protein [Azohydromonas lata]|uniref:methyl-accepting chemotaxis protein n=1 Tax=Azohydromonas lata TaxID=45677 RepID=UPI0008327480|nr:methyl-accepting chemotaxis protein [Azohydromonas lata]